MTVNRRWQAKREPASETQPPGQATPLVSAGFDLDVDLALSLELEVPEQLGDMAGGLHVVERVGDLALRVDDERRADHPGDLLAVHHLLAPGAVRLERRLLGVGQQRE